MPDDSPSSISCRALCGAQVLNRKRVWQGLGPRFPLVKRVFDSFPPLANTDKGKDEWMVEASDNLKPEQDVVPPWAEASPGYASMATAALADKPFRFGMREICGCTMVFIVSRKRVYLGLFPSAAKVDNARN